GSSWSNAASTAWRSSSKNSGSFIAAGVGYAIRFVPCSRLILFFGLFFGLERFGEELSVGFLQQNLDAAFRLFELLLALAGKLNTFLEQFHGVVQSELRAFQASHDFFEPG